jgi:Calcium binding
VKENKTRERRIEMEVVVDAYNESERAIGWYYYLEERLKFPFKAGCKIQAWGFSVAHRGKHKRLGNGSGKGM